MGCLSNEYQQVKVLGGVNIFAEVKEIENVKVLGEVNLLKKIQFLERGMCLKRLKGYMNKWKRVI